MRRNEGEKEILTEILGPQSQNLVSVSSNYIAACWHPNTMKE